jgi:hypothetical protein
MAWLGMGPEESTARFCVVGTRKDETFDRDGQTAKAVDVPLMCGAVQTITDHARPAGGTR